jgi:hypothetical protein
MVGASDVSIPRVVTRVLTARLCFAKHTAGASDVNIPMVVTRALRVQHCSASHTVVESDVNDILKVVTRALSQGATLFCCNVAIPRSHGGWVDKRSPRMQVAVGSSLNFVPSTPQFV